ncbi:MAG: SGNH/GDSL hydrolase family protein, partial [Bacteroidota bacterium]
AILLLLTASCQEDICAPQSASDSAIVLLPLGDSRVEGGSPEFESYRYELWKLLTQNAWETDFVGSRQDENKYEDVNQQCFDNEHEGTGGAQTPDILNTLQRLNLEKEPDVVLLGIGGNDLTEGGAEVSEVIDNIQQIIIALRARNESVVILLEQIAPGRSDFMTADLQSSFEQFNQQVAGLADLQNNSKIVVINMAQDWKDDYMADEVHYNQAGAEVVAQRYFQAIKEYVER